MTFTPRLGLYTTNAISTTLMVKTRQLRSSRCVVWPSTAGLNKTVCLLQRALLVEAMPEVSRVIFIATPHRGSFLAGNFVSDTVSTMVDFPSEVVDEASIAVKGDGPVSLDNDGVVEYASAHLIDALSEAVVQSNHSTQSHPNTIAEVRRILVEHIQSSPCAALPRP